MKRYIHYLAIALFLTSCSSLVCEQDQPEVAPSPVFYSSFENVDSKTFVDGDLNLLWHADDRVSIFTNTYNQQYRFKGSTGDNSGEFEKVSSGSFVTGNPISKNYAVYPYMDQTAISYDETITVNFPAIQQYAENSFGKEANIMVAATADCEDTFLPFKNISGYLVIKLYGDATVKSLTFEGNNAEKIAGSGEVVADPESDPSIVFGDSGQTSITIDCGDGVTIGTTKETATPFWFCIPPTTFSKGFTVTVTDVDGNTMTKQVNSSKTIVRNVKVAMAAIEASFVSIINISNYDEFIAFRDATNDGNNFKNSIVNLLCDIEITDSFWIPISYEYNNSGVSGHLFQGVFDGCGHTVRFNTVTSSAYWSNKYHYKQALFASVQDAVIKNVNVSGTQTDNVNSGSNMMWGGIVADARNTTISNCQSSIIYSGIADYGGIVNTADGCKIFDCKNIGSVSVTTSANAAGICCLQYNSVIESCANTADISSAGGVAAGISAGYGTATIACTNEGNVEGGYAYAISSSANVVCSTNFGDAKSSKHSGVSVYAGFAEICYGCYSFGNFSEYDRSEYVTVVPFVLDKAHHCVFSPYSASSSGSSDNIALDYGVDVNDYISYLNEGVDMWNIAYPDNVCNYHYDYQDHKPIIVKN